MEQLKQFAVTYESHKQTAGEIKGTGKTPSGTPSVSDSDGEDEEHIGQAVYHFCREVHHGSRTPRVECTISTTLGGHRKGFVKRSLPDSGAIISILGL